MEDIKIPKTTLCLSTYWMKETCTTIEETTRRIHSWGRNRSFIGVTSRPQEENMGLSSLHVASLMFLAAVILTSAPLIEWKTEQQWTIINFCGRGCETKDITGESS